MAVQPGLVPEEEYLRMSCKPACEYIDGVLRQKSMGTRKHARLQGRLAELLAGWHEFEANIELTVRIREGKWLVPDVALQERAKIQDPYPTDPVVLCVEVLSPEDRIGETFT